MASRAYTNTSHNTFHASHIIKPIIFSGKTIIVDNPSSYTCHNCRHLMENQFLKPNGSTNLHDQMKYPYYPGFHLEVTLQPRFLLITLLLYPKICPPIFFKKLPNQVSKFPKGCTVQEPPKQSKLGFVL